MAYENVYGTDEDIEKYKLNEVWDRYHIAPRRQEKRFWGRSPELTIDRERDCFMLVNGTAPIDGGSQYRIIFSINGCEVLVRLNLVRGSSGKFTDNPFLRVWDLANLQRAKECDISDSEIVSEIKLAMTTYGYSGIHKQIPNTKVVFNF